jgi:NitT/TauT family transport system substrate-binding protein
MKLRIAVPDLVSNSYFPVVAAATLGAFEEQGLDVSLELVSPLPKCIDALRDGSIHFVGASAHAPLLSFENWNGAKLLCAQSQGTYWLLVMRRDLGIARGDLNALRGKRIAAVPFVGQLLAHMLKKSGIAPNDVEIVVPEFAARPGTNFGVAAAEALGAGAIDGFFANGVGAELVVSSGLASLVLDIRRGDGPAECFRYTMPSVATTDEMIANAPDLAAAVIRAVIKTQRALKSNPALATEVGSKLFDAQVAPIIAKVVERDLPFYEPSISRSFVTTMNRYSQEIGLLTFERSYDDVVPERFRSEWTWVPR